MRERGFSLVELLIALSIITTVFAIGSASFNRFNRRERLKQSGQTLKSSLRFAQTKAISREKPDTGCTSYTGMALSFTADGYSVRPECAPEGPAGTATSVTFSRGITLSPVPAGFTFHSDGSLGTGSTDVTITIVNGTESYVLSVSSSGSVSDRGM
jgi:prepilin-type N-terminal cleavage/methylation domain-containing protein